MYISSDDVRTIPHVILTSILFQREEGAHRNYCKIIMVVIMFFLFLPEKYLNSLNTKDLQDLDFFLLAKFFGSRVGYQY